MNGNKLGVVTLVVSLLTLGVVFFHGGAQGPAGHDGVDGQSPDFGAASGQDFSFKANFLVGAVFGGRVLASSTVATETLAKTDIFDVSYFNAKAAADATLTLPTKTVLGATNFLPNPGDKWIWQVHASGSVITLASATGVALTATASSSKIYPTRTGTVIFTRLSKNEGSTIEALLLNNF